MLEEFIDLILPGIISVLELMGIFVVVVSALGAFARYIKMLITKENIDIKSALANGLATSLEFKMGAEILKTVQVQEMGELKILGAVILLRAILSLMIHFEMKEHRQAEKEHTV